MATIKLNSGMASIYFVTDAKQNLVLLDNPYMVFSNSVLTKSLLSEILMRIYNIEHPKGFLGMMPKQAGKEAIEKLLEDLINERKFSATLMGSNRPILVIAKGIEKQCLFSMKVLKLRGLSSLAAINIRNDHEKIGESIEATEEIKNSEIYHDTIAVVYRPPKLRVAIGKHKTVITTCNDFKTLIRENADIVTPLQDRPITDKCQIVDEGMYE